MSEERPPARETTTWSTVLDSILVLLVVAGWGAYLVPFWVRRHDGPAAEMRSIQGFSTAMRTLSRRKPRYIDGRYVVMPGTRTKTALPQPVHVSGPGARRAVDGALAHRRRALLSLLVLSLVSVPLAVFVGGVCVWLLIGSVLATASYSMMLRRETVRANERRRRARQLERRRQNETARAEYVDRVAAQAQPVQPVMQPRPVRYVEPRLADERVEPEWQRAVGG